MTYQQPSYTNTDLNDFLMPDDQSNPGMLSMCAPYATKYAIYNHQCNSNQLADEEEPDYLSHDLNTPKVERQNISFRTRNI